MMGKKKLSETRAQVRDAFRRAGIDPDTWFAQEVRKVEQRPAAGSVVLETLRVLRDALAREVRRVPKKRKKRSAV
jgi:hypothetical protein